MKLFLHAGTEKTGSSFLQMVAARNRELLKESGIYFPKGGKREKDMLEGRVSPGNGKALFDALKKNDVQQTSQIVKDAAEAASRYNCSAVLFSNENLIELHLKDNALDTLVSVSRSAGFKEIDALVVLRDPVDQALSLYKHRAKSGNVKSVDKWVKEDFHTMRVLEAFLEKRHAQGIQWHCTKYENDSGRMCQAFFRQWLQIAKAVPFTESVVNPSLTLSELLFLKNQYKVNPDLVAPYYEVLLRIDKSLKAGNPALESSYKKIIAEELATFAVVIRELNQLLDKSQQLQVPAQGIPVAGDVEQDPSISLSEHQVLALMKKQHELYGLNGQVRTMIARLKKKAVKLVGNK